MCVVQEGKRQQALGTLYLLSFIFPRGGDFFFIRFPLNARGSDAVLGLKPTSCVIRNRSARRKPNNTTKQRTTGGGGEVWINPSNCFPQLKRQWAPVGFSLLALKENHCGIGHGRGMRKLFKKYTVAISKIHVLFVLEFQRSSTCYLNHTFQNLRMEC